MCLNQKCVDVSSVGVPRCSGCSTHGVSNSSPIYNADLETARQICATLFVPCSFAMFTLILARINCHWQTHATHSRNALHRAGGRSLL